MEKKVQMLIWVSSRCDVEWRQFLAEKYGEIRKGHLSFEAEQAFNRHIAAHTSTQSKVNPGPRMPIPSPNVFVVKGQVADYLRQKFAYEALDVIPRSHLDTAIMAWRGTDRRTLRKWLRLFVKFKVIKILTPGTVKWLGDDEKEKT